MKSLNQIFFLIVIFTLVCHPKNVPAQNTRIIKGQVRNEKGKPLAYANIFLKNRFEGVMSDEQGNYQLKFKGADQVTLVCTFMGYESFEKELTLQRGAVEKLNIRLKPTLIQGKTVTVSASAFTAADEEGVTLTSLDVVRTPGAAADIFWAIKSFPGLQQVEEGAGLFVRGGDVSETLFMLDGAIINHPYRYESPTGGYFGTFSPFLLKGTFFSSGGFSAQFGDALSGALSMESLDLPDRRQVGLGMGLAAESAYLSVPIIKDKFGFSFSGNLSNTEMLFRLNQSQKDFSHYPSAYDINLNTIYKINQNSEVKFFVFQENDQVGVEVDDPDYASHFHGDNSNRLYNFKLTHQVNQKWLFTGNLAFNDFQRELDLSVMHLNLADRLSQCRLSLEGELTKNISFRAGNYFLRYRTIISGQVPQNELDLSPSAPIDLVSTNYTSDRAAQYLEFDVPTLLGILLKAGLRGEYESTSRDYLIDPRVSLVYPISATSNISAAAGRYHQFPKPEYYDPFIGNPNLSAMEASHWILGYLYQQENRIFRVECYYKKYHHLLLKDAVQNYTNGGYGYARGLDFFAKDASGPISGWVAYSWLQARRQWMDLPVLASPYFDITHNFTAVLNWDLPFNLSIGSSFRYATGKPYTPAPGQYHSARVPDYQKVDLTFSYRCSFFESNLTIFYLALSNITGRINIFDYRYSPDYQRRDAVESAYGRSLYFGMSFNM